MSVPILYEAGTTDFWNMGLGPLSDALTATVTEERNGEFYLDLTYPIDGVRANELKNGRMIVVDAGHTLKAQRFDITDVQRKLAALVVHAEHVSYRTSRYPMAPHFEVSGDADLAIKAWQNAIVVDNGITADSDISTTGTVDLTIDKAQNARQVLGGVEGSILDVFGGEYRFDNERISLLNHRGSVVNTLLAYGRNITDFNQEEAIGETYTSIYPYALETVNSDSGTSSTNLVTLPEYFVDGSYVKNFPQRRVAPVDFSDKFDSEKDPVTQDKLRDLAKAYVKDNDVGVPKVTTTISFVDLSKTTDYLDVASLEEVDLCDEVPFWFSKYDIRTTAKVSSVVWNVLNDSYDSLTLGDLAASLSESIQSIATTSASAVAQKTVLTVLQSADGITSNIYTDGSAEPPTATKIGDRWFQDNGDKGKTVYVWDGTAWRELVSTDTANKIAADIDAKMAANAALIAQNKADVDAAVANVTQSIEQAKADTATAIKNADLAVTNAGKALDASGLATASAQAASDAATAAKQLATEVSNTFATVQSQAATAASDAATALEQAKSALATANGVSGDYTTLKKTVDDTTATVSTLATQTSVDAVKQTVTTTQALAEQTANGLSLKADTTVVDTINNTVKQQAIDIKAAQDQLALTLTASDLAKGLSGYATQTWAQNQITATAKGWEAQLSTVQAQYNDIGQSQGRNYVRNSRFDSGMDNWSTATSAGILTTDTTSASQTNLGKPGLHIYGTTTAYYQGITQLISLKLQKGQKFVIGMLQSFDGQTSAGALRIGVHYRDSTGAILSQEWHDYTCDATWGDVYGRNSIVYTAADDCSSVLLMIYAPAPNYTFNAYITEVSLTVGPTSFGWQAAPEDTATYTDTKVAELKLTVDGLTGTFAKSADLATATAQIKVNASGLSAVTAVTGVKGEKVTSLIADVDSIKSTMTGANGVTTRLQTLEGFQSTATSNITNLQTQQTTLAGQYTSLIESTDNKVRKPWFDDGQTGTWSGSNPIVGGPDSNVQKLTGHSRYLKLVGRDNYEGGVGWFSVTPGEVYYFSGYMGSWGTTYAVGVGFNFVTEAGTNSWVKAASFPANSKTSMSAIAGSVTVPAGVVRARTWVQIDGAAGADLGYAAIDGLRISKSASSTQITQLQGLIDARVTVDGKIAAALSLSADGGGTVLIRGASLYVTAASHFDAASIQSAAIANLDAAKITTGVISADRIATTKLNATNITSGTLDAGKLTVKNLSASSITSGTFNAANATIINLNGAAITAGTITADKLAANAILVGINNGLKKLRLDPNGMFLHGTTSDIGYISSSNPAIDTSLNGLAFNLSSTADYMSWSAQNRGDSSGQYQGKMTWARADVADKMNIAAGFTFDDDALFMGGLSVVGQAIFMSATQFGNPVMFGSEIADADNVRGRFGHVSVDGTNCFGLFDSTGKCGVAMSGSNLYFIRGGKAYSLADLHTLK